MGGKWEIVQADIMDWCASYTGEPFSAILCDPPFHLTPNRGGLAQCGGCGAKMARRYRYCHQCGAEMPAKAISQGFMSAQWDGTTDGELLAFQPELWQALAQHLHPGAWILAFASSRGHHRLAVALEDAGMVYQPDVFIQGVGVVEAAGLLLHVTGQSFPKATRIDTKIDEANGRKFEARYVLGMHIREMREAKGISRDEVNARFESVAICNHWEAQSASNAIIPLPEHWEILKEWLGCDSQFDVLVNRAGAEREVLGVQQGAMRDWNMDGTTQYVDRDITAPATPLAAAWEGHRYGGQILRDLACPIVCAQKPWGRDRLGDIVATGAGALWVEGGRVAHNEPIKLTTRTTDKFGTVVYNRSHSRTGDDLAGPTPSGRWPPNLVLSHFARTLPSGEIWGCHPLFVPAPCPACSGDGCPDCGGSGEVLAAGVRRVKGTGTFVGANLDPLADKLGTVYGKYCKVARNAGYADEDGKESVPRYSCARHCAACGHWWTSEEATVCECGESGEWCCAVRRLGDDGGETPSNWRKNKGDGAGKGMFGVSGGDTQGHKDAGTVARYYPNPDHVYERIERPFWADASERLALGPVSKYAAKPSRAERDAGLEDMPLQTRNRVNPGGLENEPRWAPVQMRNPHPCVKSLSLTKWLATLLLPPAIYAPRRLLVPFCGTFSEGIGGLLAGFEYVLGIDSEANYCDIADARARFWTGWSQRTGSAEPKAILKAHRKARKAEAKREAEAEQMRMELGAC